MIQFLIRMWKRCHLFEEFFIFFSVCLLNCSLSMTLRIVHSIFSCLFGRIHCACIFFVKLSKYLKRINRKSNRKHRIETKAYKIWISCELPSIINFNFLFYFFFCICLIFWLKRDNEKECLPQLYFFFVSNTFTNF